MQKTGVYILSCKNGRYYIGSTKNLEVRLMEHENGKVKSTKHILPVHLAFFQECETIQQARQLEYKIKSKKSKVIIDQIVKDGYIRFMRA